jgi:chromosome segregation ATPase
MEEPKVRPGFPGDRSQAAAEKLRALRERANDALAAHRTRLGTIENELGERVRKLAEEFNGVPTSPANGPTVEDELDDLRRQLEESDAKHARFVEQLVAARQQLDEIQSQPCPSCEQAAQQVAAAEEDVLNLRSQLDAATRAHEEDCVRHEKFVEQLTAARQAINVLQQAAGEASHELRAELEAVRTAKAQAEEQLAAALRDHAALHDECDAAITRATGLETEAEAARSEIAALHAQLASLTQAQSETTGIEQQLRQQLDALAAQLTVAAKENETLSAQAASVEQVAQANQSELQEKFFAAQGEVETLRQQITAAEAAKLSLELSLSQSESARLKLESDLQKLEQEVAAAQSAAEAETPQLRTQLEQAESAAAAHQEALGELAQMLEQARQELAELRLTMAPRTDLDAALRELEAANASVTELRSAKNNAEARRDAAESEAAKLSTDPRPAAELDELQQKFDLALADVQKFKRENSVLRDELAQRPAGDLESPELIAIRKERDELVARVADLAAAVEASATVDHDGQQERDDLQRRFEMAVDDVRQLKQENSQLREKLAAAGSANGAEADAAEGGDWAAQRARLMAMLEQEDDAGEVSAERTAERATVSKTIAATDRVIANKDQEILELRAKLESNVRDGVDDETAAAREAVLDADEAVAAERQRLAKLTAEWEAKQRAAELEFSVERARLAREQAALREKMFEIESGTYVAAQGDGPDGTKPRRRWLSALGLHEEEQKPKKK